MTLAEILNADMATIARWLRAGWRWWIGELSTLAPAGVRRLLDSRPRLAAVWSGDRFRLYRDGRLLDLGNGTRSAQTRPRPVLLLLGGHDVLVREIETPPLPLADVRRMVTLDADRLTPFAPDAVYVDAEILERGQRRQTVAVAAWPRAAADRMLALALDHGLSPRVISVGAPSLDTPKFNFRPLVDAAAGTSGEPPRAALLWALAALLLLANGATLILRDIADLERLRSVVEAQAPAVDGALRLRQRVVAEQVARQALFDRRAAHDPVRTLNVLSRAVPLSAWVQRLAWTGGTARIAGYAKGGANVLEALRQAPEIAAARPSTDDVPAAVPAGQPFDITVTFKPSGRPS